MKHLAVLLGFARAQRCVIVGRDCFASKTMNAHASDKTRILAAAAACSSGSACCGSARLPRPQHGRLQPSPYAYPGRPRDPTGSRSRCRRRPFYDRAHRPGEKPLFASRPSSSKPRSTLLVASGNTNDIALIAGIAGDGGHGLVMSILCWMEVFTSYRPRLSLIAAAYPH